MARYLIEDNTENNIEFDLDRTNKMHIVKSIFKNLVGNFKLLSIEEENKLRADTVEVFFRVFINILRILADFQI